MDNCLLDLHLHIDGALSPETAIALAEMQDFALPTYDRTQLRSYLCAPKNCRDLPDYLRAFDLPIALMQTAPAISESVCRLQNELATEGIAYAELRFAPQQHTKKGLSQDEVVAAAIDGLHRAPLPANLILCCMRFEDNTAENLETIRVARRYLGRGVVCVDLAGAEAAYPVGNYRDVFAYAQAQDVPFIIHAGEAAGAQSVKNAVQLGAVRIGHGVRSAEDTAVMALLAEKKIPLELCPTSNLDTKIYPNLAAYPLPILREHGVILTVNTDNPTVSDTTLRREFSLLQAQFGAEAVEIKTLLQNAVTASFADDCLKAELRRRIAASAVTDG